MNDSPKSWGEVPISPDFQRWLIKRTLELEKAIEDNRLQYMFYPHSSPLNLFDFKPIPNVDATLSSGDNGGDE